MMRIRIVNEVSSAVRSTLNLERTFRLVTESGTEYGAHVSPLAACGGLMPDQFDLNVGFGILPRLSLEAGEAVEGTMCFTVRDEDDELVLLSEFPLRLNSDASGFVIVVQRSAQQVALAGFVLA